MAQSVTQFRSSRKRKATLKKIVYRKSSLINPDLKGVSEKLFENWK